MLAVLQNLLSPIPLAFLIIIIGYFLGRIKCFGISLDLSGVLIVAVITGWLFMKVDLLQALIDIEECNNNMKYFSSFGTALFISSIGISSGTLFNMKKKKDIKAMLIGSLMTVSAFAAMKIIAALDREISFSKLLGSLCGALTTTPGLSSACELETVSANDAVLGYGCTYLFGVVATVLYVQVATKSSVVVDRADAALNNKNKSALSGLIQIGCAVIFGRIIGSVKIFGFSLGGSGGMLCAGMLVGVIIKKFFADRVLTSTSLTPFRNAGLTLFFVGNGIPAGMQLSGQLDVKTLIYGIFMTIIPITVGASLYKLLFKDKYTAATVAGGMTSTPAIGILLQKNSSVDLNKYSAAYIGSLLTIVFMIRMV